MRYFESDEVEFMILDMTPILNGSVTKIPFRYEYTPGDALADDIVFPAPVTVSGEVANMAGYMKLTLSTDFSYDTECARCLAPIHKEMHLTVERDVAGEKMLEEEDNDDYLIFGQDGLDLDEPTEELLFVNIPMRHLCREDCLGLCPGCGKDLNEGPCSCAKKKTDPRLAILGQLLQKDPDTESNDISLTEGGATNGSTEE